LNQIQKHGDRLRIDDKNIWHMRISPWPHGHFHSLSTWGTPDTLDSKKNSFGIIMMIHDDLMMIRISHIFLITNPILWKSLNIPMWFSFLGWMKFRLEKTWYLHFSGEIYDDNPLVFSCFHSKSTSFRNGNPPFFSFFPPNSTSSSGFFRRRWHHEASSGPRRCSCRSRERRTWCSSALRWAHAKRWMGNFFMKLSRI